MGGGYHGGFGGTGGAAAGDAVFKSSPEQFFKNAARRADKDRNGVFDVVAHGKSSVILVEHGDTVIEADSRTVARLIKGRPGYKKGQPIRLLSCDTGSSTSGFAQNLANKLNVVVEAPTKIVWAYPSGKIIVAGRRKDNPQLPDLGNRGTFKKFYPGGKKR